METGKECVAMVTEYFIAIDVFSVELLACPGLETNSSQLATGYSYCSKNSILTCDLCTSLAILVSEKYVSTLEHWRPRGFKKLKVNLKFVTKQN